jgi:hypothetical protein
VRGARLTVGPTGIRRTAGISGSGLLDTSCNGWDSGAHASQPFHAAVSELQGLQRFTDDLVLVLLDVMPPLFFFANEPFLLFLTEKLPAAAWRASAAAGLCRRVCRNRRRAAKPTEESRCSLRISTVSRKPGRGCACSRPRSGVLVLPE